MSGRGWLLLASASLLSGCIPPGVDEPEHAPAPVFTPPPPAEAPPAEADYGVSSSSTPTQAPQQLGGGVTAAPAPPPAWRTRPVTADAQAIPPGTYTVRPGDTLRGIADRTGSGAEVIAHANNLAPPFTLRAGQRLDIPGGRYHLVRPGETGIAIARAYGVDWSRIVSANDLQDPYTLRAGMRILIPGDLPGVSLAAQRAAAFNIDIDDIITGSSPAPVPGKRPERPSTSAAARAPSPIAPVQEPTRLRGAFAWPVNGQVIGRFGPGRSGERLNGINIAVPLGTSVLAAADGVVVYAGNEISSLGGLVIIKHGDNWTTVYGHCRDLLVRRGQAVKRGQPVARSGDSGNADRPQLHFELRRGRNPVDPLGQLPRS